MDTSTRGAMANEGEGWDWWDVDERPQLWRARTRIKTLVMDDGMVPQKATSAVGLVSLVFIHMLAKPVECLPLSVACEVDRVVTGNGLVREGNLIN